MDEVAEFFGKLLNTADWPPRWHCGKWSGFHGWFYIISDLLIWSAYFAIPLIIIKYISRRKDVQFHKIYFLFAAFILACGSTHFLDAIMFWFPVYRLSALVRFFTGIISWVTVFYLIRMLPLAFSLKSSQQLEQEVDHRRKVEEELLRTNAQLNEAQEIARLGNWEWDIKTNRILWSPGLFKIFGIPPDNSDLFYGRFIEMVHPDDRDDVKGILQKAIAEKAFTEFYYRILLPGEQIKVVHAKGDVILNDKEEVVKFIGTAQDVTIQKDAEQQIVLKSKELEAVNIELQKFAFVASHDMQEPLRKIITFTTLLQKDLNEDLSESRKFYIDKVVSSTLRMQKLIDDILNFSRLSAGEITFSETDIKAIVQQVFSDMEVLIASTGTEIVLDTMPVMEVNASQFGQLFQNLISNAIKFSRPGHPPRIHIYSEVIRRNELSQEFIVEMIKTQSRLKNEIPGSEEYCKIYVADNGIGFDEQYLDKLFEIFQRLHSKSAYEGTGIGLAVCKRIVETHHGILTAKSVAGQGSTFILIVPLSQTPYR